jgi:hypothetical protein
MKLLILILCLSTGLCFSQGISNELVVSTQNRDTLYIKDDNLGRLIYSSWERSPVKSEPVPVRVLVQDLKPYRERLYNTNTKNKKG